MNRRLKCNLFSKRMLATEHNKFVTKPDHKVSFSCTRFLLVSIANKEVWQLETKKATVSTTVEAYATLK